MLNFSYLLNLFFLHWRSYVRSLTSQLFLILIFSKILIFIILLFLVYCVLFFLQKTILFPPKVQSMKMVGSDCSNVSILLCFKKTKNYNLFFVPEILLPSHCFYSCFCSTKAMKLSYFYISFQIGFWFQISGSIFMLRDLKKLISLANL